jgi:hypothetical protein
MIRTDRIIYLQESVGRAIGDICKYEKEGIRRKFSYVRPA